MALVNIDSVIRTLVQKLKKLSPPQGIELLSYKRNRSVTVLWQKDGLLTVRERGYHEENFLVERSALQKLIKSLIKREFPRSRKLRLYQVAGPEGLDRPRKKL